MRREGEGRERGREERRGRKGGEGGKEEREGRRETGISV